MLSKDSAKAVEVSEQFPALLKDALMSALGGVAEVVLALHHRAISGTNMSEIDDKIITWLEKLGEALKGNIGKAWAAGKKATK